MTLKELKKALLDFDRVHHSYPEHEYEGLAIWKWITNDARENDGRINYYLDYIGNEEWD